MLLKLENGKIPRKETRKINCLVSLACRVDEFNRYVRFGEIQEATQKYLRMFQDMWKET